MARGPNPAQQCHKFGPLQSTNYCYNCNKLKMTTHNANYSVLFTCFLTQVRVGWCRPKINPRENFANYQIVPLQQWKTLIKLRQRWILIFVHTFGICTFTVSKSIIYIWTSGFQYQNQNRFWRSFISFATTSKFEKRVSKFICKVLKV